jgi:glycosyltransferase involved in cell wall biosynthesis
MTAVKILFLNLSTLKFDVATPDTQPLGGSESCVCYLACQLATNGHDVSLIARLPDDAPVTVHNVRHFPLAKVKDQDFFDREKFDVIVSCNAPIACPHLRSINPSSLIILWDHVPPEQPSMAELGNPEVLNAVDCIVYVSKWQKAETEKKFGITKKSVVIGNGLTPSFANMFSSAKDLLAHKQNRAAYTTIPYRGLPLLLKAMEGLQQETQLDIFSSMKLYQMPDDEYAGLYQEAVKNPRVTSHGAIPQPQLAQHLRKAAFLTYPCIVAETFCIAALEAMAAGMKVISTQLGALETTTMGYADLLPIESSNPQDLIDAFLKAMETNIQAFLTEPEKWAETMFAQVQAVNQKCSWAVRTEDWEKLFGAGRY